MPRLGPIAIALSALLLVACGDDDSPAQTGSPLSTASSTTAGATETGDSATDDEVVLVEATATLTAEAEVPGPGDPEGSGSAEVTVDGESAEVCWEVTVTGIEAVAGHIHEGGVDEAGPVVVNLGITGSGEHAGCSTADDAALLERLLDDPAGFYVNVHTAEFRDGAIRGQLS